MSWSKDVYKRAAVKHYKNCQYIFDLIPTIHNAEYKTHVFSDCYYVGGYVLECALKFFIMNKLHLSKAYSKTELESYRLLTHNLHHLWQIATEGSDPLSLEWKNLDNKTKQWSEEVRYERSCNYNVIESDLVSFRSDLETVYNIVFNQF